MEALVLAFLLLLAFVAWAPKAVMQTVLALTWAGMGLMAVGSVVYALASLLFL